MGLQNGWGRCERTERPYQAEFGLADRATRLHRCRVSVQRLATLQADDHLLTMPGEATAFSVCYQVETDDVPGAVLEIAGIDWKVTLDPGL